MMGIEHQRIHLETSSVIIRRLPIEQVRPLPAGTICPLAGQAPANELVPVAGGKVVLGKPGNHPAVRLGQRIRPSGKSRSGTSQASRHLVSNREYLGFVEDRGYEAGEVLDRRAGAGWVTPRPGTRCSGWSGPARIPFSDPGPDHRYAVELAGRSQLPRGQGLLQLAGRKNRQNPSAERGRVVPAARPARHPRSAVLAEGAGQHQPGALGFVLSGDSFPFRRVSTISSAMSGSGRRRRSPALKDLHVHPWYDDFSTPTFDTQHNLIKGGSWISTGNEATRDSRYAFRRHFFQHAGFRYVEADQPLEVPQAMYESDAAVSQYCEAHYGRTFFGVANFPATCARICLELMGDRPKQPRPRSRLLGRSGQFRAGQGVPLRQRPRFFGAIYPDRATRCRKRGRSVTNCRRRARSSPTTNGGWLISASPRRRAGSNFSRPMP